MPAVVTVTVTSTHPAVTVTSTSSGGTSSGLSAGTIAGIAIGTLLGGVLLVVLVLYLLNRYSRHKFTRVANPANVRVSTVGDPPDLPNNSSRRPKFLTHHAQKPSISSEPLMSPVSWPPLPSTSQLQTPGASPRSDPISAGIRDSDLGEISQVIASGTVSHFATPAILSIPPVRKPEQTSLRLGLGGAPPHAPQTSGDDAPSPSTSPKTQPKMFIRRMIQSRARISEGVSLSHRPSLDASTSRSSTLDSSISHVDEEQLLVEAEHTAVREAENAERDEGKIMPDEGDDWGETESIQSIYSQLSAPDQFLSFSNPVSRQNSSSSLPRRNSSRKQTRTPAFPTELPPVAEMPDTPRTLEGQSGSRHVSISGNLSLDGQVSHRTASRPMSPVIDQPGILPLLTSANFGKDTTASGTPMGSISSTAGRGSSSGGRASRYPSLATSSVGQSSQSGSRSDAGTDWHHPPSGLAALSLLQIGMLQNPHSPVEEQPEESDVLPALASAGPVPSKRAHLRGGRVTSMPEVERRTVMQGGIAHIDVAL